VALGNRGEGDDWGLLEQLAQTNQKMAGEELQGDFPTLPQRVKNQNSRIGQSSHR
jgi:hypothetical protein